MKLAEILSIYKNESIMILLKGETISYPDIKMLPDTIKQHEVEALEIRDGKLCVGLKSGAEDRSLNDLGYSFEAGI
ncbi:MAG: hypothetical protein EOM08_09525 [Clostridia bacterium]|nr:hypothetical protein [Clostridia bacterium]NCC76659.1 hypothetical protein [Clostridia bacterium]